MNQHKGKGNLFVVSAPSGTGKTTLCRVLLDRFPDIVFSVSTTTRPPRKGEKNGVDYYFMDQEHFVEKLNRGCWAEWAIVHGYYYGTSAVFLDNTLASGRNVLLDIDVQGTRQILERYANAVTIFILPPSLNVLRDRLIKRGTDSRQSIAKRLRNAEAEMSQKGLYRHVIVNDQLEETITRLVDIVARYRTGVKSALDS